MAVRIRMKRMGRRHRPFFRVCAVDRRGSRDGKVIEYLGHYDPMVGETDARASLKNERIDYWLGVGAQPSDKVAVLIKKYGTNGTHLGVQQEALERLQANKPTAPPPVAIPRPEAAAKPAAEDAVAEKPAAEKPAAEKPAAEKPAAEESVAGEAAEGPAASAAADEKGEGESTETE